MVFAPVKNFASTTLSAGIDASTTSITVTSASSFPNPGTLGSFPAVIWDSSCTNASADASHEIVTCTALSSNTFTVTRGAESTTAVAHNTSGKTYNFDLVFTAAMYDAIASGINYAIDTAVAAGSSGGGLSDCVFWSNLGC